jgi:hypothetical protein
LLGGKSAFREAHGDPKNEKTRQTTKHAPDDIVPRDHECHGSAETYYA